MSAQTDSNELLKFMNTATSNIQVALGRPCKNKRVNHRNYLKKRLQNGGPKTTKKPKVTPAHTSNRQPIAGLSPSSFSTYYTESSKNEYDQFYQLFSQPSVFSHATVPQHTTNTIAYSRPPSVHEELCDPEIESLLSEFGAESPSQCSLYGDSASIGCSRSGSLVSSSMCSSTQLSLENMVVPNDYYVLSPPSDFSDFDESNYSSPRNLSPVNNNNACYPNVSPSPPVTYYHHNLTASYDCIPTGSSSAVTLDRQNGLSLPYNPSITELIAELVSTP